jgi:hypothetical protein
MKTAQVFGLSLLSGYCLILAGCEANVRMYPGPARASDEVAVLQLGPDVGIFSIDGESFNVEKLRDIELLPGTHAVKAVYFKAPSQAMAAGKQSSIIGGLQSEQPLHLVFEAAAGRMYRLIGSLEEKVISTEGKVQIRDVVTGQVVASAAGPVQSISAPTKPASRK